MKMLSRVLDFFRRDKEKKKLPVTTIVSNPKPNEAPKEKVRRSWITRWIKNRKDKQFAKQILKRKEVFHEAHPTHCLKPLRRIRPVKFFYSTR
jgi:hypothetical protein